jgi:hypothetical protein
MSMMSISYDSETSQDTASGYKVMGETSSDDSDNGDENKSKNGDMKEINDLKLLTRGSNKIKNCSTKCWSSKNLLSLQR